MSSALKNLSSYKDASDLSGKGLKIGIAVSEWNENITSNLLDSCIDTLVKHKVDKDDIFSISVPGAFELPLACKLLLQKKGVDAVIALGCVIKGETKHDDYINAAVASGLTQLAIVSNVPCIYGVVTTNDLQQAIDRSGGKHGNKGVESAVTALRMASLAKIIGEREKTIGF